jgi:6-phosphogluconolactonase
VGSIHTFEEEEARVMSQVEVVPTPSALAQTGAERVVAAAVAAIRASGRFTIALSSGSTPKALYALLATEAYATRLDWPRIHVFWGDERCVAPDHPASNYRMAREVLLDHVPVPPANVHRIRGEDEPAAAATAYERELRTTFGSVARFDLILLGMGDNGHTASLFPGLTAVRDTTRWVTAEYVGEVSMWRVTLTPVVINAAAEVLFLVSGHEKAAMLHRVLDGPSAPDALPAQVVAPRDGRLTWLVDAAAAASLEKSTRAR